MIASALVAPRATICVAPSAARLGASAPTTVAAIAMSGADHQEAPPPVAIGERRQDDREQHTGAHGREGVALRAVAGAELLGGERDRLARERGDVAEHDRREGEQPQDGRSLGVAPLWRRPPGRVAFRCAARGGRGV